MKTDVTHGKHDLKSCEAEDEISIAKIKKAAVSALSAATVTAKLLVDQEEEHIRHLAALIIDKQVILRLLEN